MKRLILMACLSLLLVGCVDREEEFQTAMDNMQSTTQMKLAITISNLPIIDTVRGTITIDHGTTQSVFLGETTYTFKEDDVAYSLVEFEGDYYLLEERIDNLISVEVASFSSFQETDFTYDDGFYYSLYDIQGMHDIRIEIENGNMVELRYTDAGGVRIEIDFTGLGEATVTLPQYIVMNAFDYALFPFVTERYAYEQTFTGFRLVSELSTMVFPSIEYYEGPASYTITLGDQIFRYNPVTRYITYNTDVSIDVGVYLVYEEIPILSEELFRALDDIHAVYQNKDSQ